MGRDGPPPRAPFREVYHVTCASRERRDTAYGGRGPWACGLLHAGDEVVN
ncbi:MAG TPA: hypothetical protein VI997_06915 [Candidatus Thermoplasmatota archaeon]|nr:hypothetical protein [Candidatus Thermoplasmatota archaeon]